MPIDPHTLHGSKWTAVTPQQPEKHFMVVKVEHDAFDTRKVLRITLEAVWTHRRCTLPWRELMDEACWRHGWL
ncbi:TIGR02450 family Trp-rich protein [Vogesella sp. LIG4]|uniref:TIGR02450 family Trp-rich protein n=1 Tax=Vogesella sp. LIG4 TaxID=1192162 RepID=UPI00081F7A38|nr:TIGR02450 family Trp-rich protein [Vogesella sp. LIG4]SCK07669.1 tryptophan-rich conserved hypothetical protein [Vogesella sp. LIG4]